MYFRLLSLQGIPGGQAALQRLYQDVQEPLLNSATSTFANNPFATLVDNSNNMGKIFYFFLHSCLSNNIFAFYCNAFALKSSVASSLSQKYFWLDIRTLSFSIT